MKSTGVVRRVDDLGRIVIPKEIRRTLRIRDGEELEIFVDNEEIILKKFSNVVDLGEVSNKIIGVVSSLVGKTILVTDRDIVVTGSGDYKKKFVNRKISKYVENVIFNRTVSVEKNLNYNELVDGDVDQHSYLIYPIISFGDVIGTVIMLSTSSDISEFDVTISGVIAQFLGKYVED